MHSWQAREQLARKLREREVSLLRFCRRIFAATVFDVVGTTLLIDVYFRTARHDAAVLLSLIHI